MSSPSVSAEQGPRSEVLAKWTPSFSAHARRGPSGVKVGLAEVNEAALLAKSGWRWSVLMTAGASCGCRKLGSACDLVFSGALSAGRLAGWV
jgi:hypothetical protein